MYTSTLDILFESDLALVINKPAGLPSAEVGSRPESDSAEKRLREIMQAREPEIDGSRDVSELFLMNRLDTLTTGCLVFTKTEEARDQIKDIWKTKCVRKFYRARVEGVFHPPRLPFDITIPIARLQKTQKRMKAIMKPSYTVGIRGEPLPAHTRILSARHLATNQTELEIEIMTGVMHQIRVHCAALGHPVVGDPIYGIARSARVRTTELGSAEGGSLEKGTRDSSLAASPSRRLFLHAERVVISLPGHDPIDVRAPIPWD